jgi:hypothetical protein
VKRGEESHVKVKRVRREKKEENGHQNGKGDEGKLSNLLICLPKNLISFQNRNEGGETHIQTDIYPVWC